MAPVLARAAAQAAAATAGGSKAFNPLVQRSVESSDGGKHVALALRVPID